MEGTECDAPTKLVKAKLITFVKKFNSTGLPNLLAKRETEKFVMGENIAGKAD
jgi:hypothetical protein